MVRAVDKSVSVELEESAIRPLESVCANRALLELSVRSHVRGQNAVLHAARVRTEESARAMGCVCVHPAGWVQCALNGVHQAVLV